MSEVNLRRGLTNSERDHDLERLGLLRLLVRLIDLGERELMSDQFARADDAVAH